MSRKVNVGLSLESELGCVPEYEEREAAIYCQYNFKQWRELDWFERSRSVAQYRLHLLIEAHIQDAVYKDSEKRRKHN